MIGTFLLNGGRTGLPQELVIHTPENAEIRVPLAGMFSRATAFVYDLGIQVALLVVEHIVFIMILDNVRWRSSLLYHLGVVQGFYLIVVFVTIFGYYTFYELFKNGQTPGKKAYGLRVVSLGGQQVGLFSSFLRNFLRIADFMPFLFFAGVVSTLITERHQRIGDLFAGTVVIRTEE